MSHQLHVFEPILNRHNPLCKIRFTGKVADVDSIGVVDESPSPDDEESGEVLYAIYEEEPPDEDPELEETNWGLGLIHDLGNGSEPSRKFEGFDPMVHRADLSD